MCIWDNAGQILEQMVMGVDHAGDDDMAAHIHHIQIGDRGRGGIQHRLHGLMRINGNNHAILDQDSRVRNLTPA